jgi:hypothetical protein
MHVSLALPPSVFNLFQLHECMLLKKVLVVNWNPFSSPSDINASSERATTRTRLFLVVINRLEDLL